MLNVGEEFLKRLQAGEMPQDDNLLPLRPWHADKLDRFLNQLKAQTTHEAPVPGT